MAPRGHQVNCGFKKTKEEDPIKKYANCHRSAYFMRKEKKCFRYDQSAINLVLLPYKNSFLGNWATAYAWTKRSVERGMSPLLCENNED